MKCPDCGANNPAYAFHCGNCAKGLCVTITTRKEAMAQENEERPLEGFRHHATTTSLGRGSESQKLAEELRNELRDQRIAAPFRTKAMAVALVVSMLLGIALLSINSLTYFD